MITQSASKRKLVLRRNHVYNLDARIALHGLPSGIVSCVVTSPPYWGLRDYTQLDQQDYELAEIEPLIWDEPVAPCDHAWGKVDPLRRWTPGDIPGPNSKINVRRSVAENRPGKESWFCETCGAWKGHLGNEPNPDLYVKHVADILDETKRVLRNDGTLWVNIGDSWGKSGGAGGDWTSGKRATEKKWKQNTQYLDVPAKSLVGIPERFALEMTRNRGWIRRATHPWVKPAPMPNSQKDRDTPDFEYVYFFVKSTNNLYFTNRKTLAIQAEQPLGIKGIENIDFEYITCPRCEGKGYIITKQKKDKSNEGLMAWGSPQSPATLQGMGGEIPPSQETTKKTCKRCKGLKVVKRSYWQSYDYYYQIQYEPLKKPGEKGNPFGGTKRAGGDNATYSGREYDAEQMLGRVARTTWVFDTNKYAGKHHATFPIELPLRAIRRGCPEYICSRCGLPQQTVVQIVTVDKEGWGPAKKDHTGNILGSQSPIREGNGRCGTSCVKHLGMAKCGCNAPMVRAIVLDPFGGSGTVGKAALKLNRDYILCELNPQYALECKENLDSNQARLF